MSLSVAGDITGWRTMLTVPKAVHSHRVHLNKMGCVVTDGAGVL